MDSNGLPTITGEVAGQTCTIRTVEGGSLFAGKLDCLPDSEFFGHSPEQMVATLTAQVLAMHADGRL